MSLTLGTTLDDILDAFRRADQENNGRFITEAAIVGGSLRFRWQGNGKLGVVVGEIGIRDAKPSELDELDDAIELGQVQIYTAPLYSAGQRMKRTLLHRATGTPLDPNSDAARRQQERFVRAEALREMESRKARPRP